MDPSLGPVLSSMSETNAYRRTQDAWFDETLKLLTIYYLLFFWVALTEHQ